MTKLPRLATREDLPLLFNLLGFTTGGVEVGVAFGGFSSVLRERWQRGTLFLVDRWQHVEGWQDNANVWQHVQDAHQAHVRAMFAGNSDVTIIQADSVEAAARFEDGSLDWVYLDADHSYEAVCRDLAAWYPKVRAGGLICGHDFLDGEHFNATFGVKSAVEELAREHDLQIVTTADPSCPSWYARKESLCQENS